MLFIALLIATAAAVAGAAAYFSVYGLAYTFSGVFWSVVAMGVSLEAAKLMAASYLYRYWTVTSLALKGYLMTGIAALMLLTSVGIFGYLSAGYQQDVLPLKQKTERVALLEEEKQRVIERKRQIDSLMASGPAVTNVNRADGTLDPNAARVLRETNRARSTTIQQYRAEQAEVTKRLTELDQELLVLKQELIQTEAKVGPITYIAKAFGLPSDDATKYLIFIIIFAFDPMAVALTLAVNIALRLRNEEKNKQASPAPVPISTAPTVVNDPQPPALPENTKDQPIEPTLFEVMQPSTKPVEQPVSLPEQTPAAEVSALEPAEAQRDEGEQASVQTRQLIHDTGGNIPVPSDKMRELINHYKYLRAKQDNGTVLSREEVWEMSAIESVLQKNNLTMYLN